RAIRASMGSLFSLPLVEVGGPADLERWLAGRPGVQVVGTDSAGEAVLGDLDLRRPTVVVVGNEAAGASYGLRALCGTVARIPMVGSADSLNMGGGSLHRAVRGGPPAGGGQVTRLIAVVRPPSISSSTAPGRPGPGAPRVGGASFRGVPRIIATKRSRSKPSMPPAGPVMPTSTTSAVPPASRCSGSVGSCVCVPSTAAAVPSTAW